MLITPARDHRTGLRLKPFTEQPAEAGSSFPTLIPALKDRSITLRASLLKQAPTTVRCPDPATAASRIEKESGIRSLVLRHSPIAHFNPIKTNGLCSFSIHICQSSFSLVAPRLRRPVREGKLPSPTVAVASRPPSSFFRAFGSKRRPGGHRYAGSFSLVPPPLRCPIREKKLQSRDVAAVSRPPCFEPKGSKAEEFGLETEPTSADRRNQ